MNKRILENNCKEKREKTNKEDWETGEKQAEGRTEWCASSSLAFFCFCVSHFSRYGNTSKPGQVLSQNITIDIQYQNIFRERQISLPMLILTPLFKFHKNKNIRPYINHLRQNIFSASNNEQRYLF